METLTTTNGNGRGPEPTEADGSTFVRLSGTHGSVQVRLDKNGTYSVSVKRHDEGVFRHSVSGSLTDPLAEPVIGTPPELNGPIEMPGGLVIDAHRREALVNGQVVPMANREWQLLLYLARDPYRVATKQELLKHIWGVDGAATRSRTIDSHASRLRQKLAAFGYRAVMNCWGVGYRLLDPGEHERSE